MKISTRNLMRALRLYGLADDNTPMKAIRRLQLHDGDSFVRAEFVLDKHKYAVLYGSGVDEEALDELWPHRPRDIELLPNPLDPTTAELPFQGKYLILMRLPIRSQRLDQFLAAEFDNSLSRSQWQKHIKAGHVSVNGVIVTQPRRDINDNDAIAVSLPEAPQLSQPLPVLYEDNDCIVADKPIGMLTHAKGGITQEHTVASIMQSRTFFVDQNDRPGIVHRLDRDTSGVIIIARHPEAMTHLQAEFARRHAQKTYLAIVEGRLHHDSARIDLPIGRHPQKPSTFRIDPNGKPAQTDYRVLATNGARSLVLLQPKTGRTHQLRVHLSHLGTPIVGDRVYGHPDERLFLHAYQLHLTLPSGKPHTFTAPIPAAFYQQFSEIESLL